MISSLRTRPVGLALLAVGLLAGCRGSEEAGAAPVAIGTEPGNRPPALVGTSGGGESFALPENPGSPRVLVFYRSASCGLCRVQLEQLQRHLPAYDAQGAEVVGITLDPPEVSARLAEELALTFPLISVDSVTFRDWGVMDPDESVPLPATFILDEEGLVHFQHVGRNAADRVSDPAIIAVLQELRSP